MPWRWAIIAYNVLKVKSEGPLIVKLEILKKGLMTVIFAVTIPISVQAVVWGLVAIAFCDMVVNFLATTRFTSFGTGRFVRTVLPMLLTAGAMYAVVRLTGLAVPGNALLRLLAEVGAGVVSYLLLSALFRLEAFGEVVAIVRKQFNRRQYAPAAQDIPGKQSPDTRSSCIRRFVLRCAESLAARLVCQA